LGQMCITNAESHPFIMAVIGGHSDIVELLLNEDSIVNSLALIKACEYSRGKVVRRLLDDGRCDPAADDLGRKKRGRTVVTFGRWASGSNLKSFACL
jgi:hypothetical protein